MIRPNKLTMRKPYQRTEFDTSARELSIYAAICILYGAYVIRNVVDLLDHLHDSMTTYRDAFYAERFRIAVVANAIYTAPLYSIILFWWVAHDVAFMRKWPPLGSCIAGFLGGALALFSLFNSVMDSDSMHFMYVIAYLMLTTGLSTVQMRFLLENISALVKTCVG